MFGHIPGVRPGQIFEDRKALRDAGIHAPLMAGIWGAQEGAYSIVLSGGYEDDIDELDYILYTGQGGQDTPGGKQVNHQEFTKGNKGLQISCDYGLPVRVTRGHQIKNGPVSGYRYDGLYRVQKYERIIGKRGLYICRFHLESETNIENLEQIAAGNLKSTYQRANRTELKVNRLNRNIKISEKVKELYEYRCQVCKTLLHSPSGPIAIGAHIKPLGKPHNGPDVLSNMLCLCPNHHDQFDKLSFCVDPLNLNIIGLDGYEGEKLRVISRHKIDEELLRYHRSLYDSL